MLNTDFIYYNIQVMIDFKESYSYIGKFVKFSYYCLISVLSNDFNNQKRVPIGKL